jgi:hypothetical protein
VPFTPAHVAAVLPLARKDRPRWAVPSALVVGSMVPDVLYFVPIRSDRSFSHSLTGLVTLDLALGLLFVGLWRAVAAPVVRDLSPGPVRSRVPVPPAATAREALWAVPCVVLGGLTHLVWDSFTHANGWMVQRISLLTEELGLPLYQLAQYGSGLLGCAVVLAYALRVPAASGSADQAPSLTTRHERLAAWLLLTVVPVGCAVAFALPVRGDGTTTEMLLYVAVVRGVSGLGLVALAVAAWWFAVVRRRTRPARPRARHDAGV